MSSHSQYLYARNSGGSNSSAGAQSLTFGFAFMAILLCLLAFAHGMQRYANRRQRAELERLGVLRDMQEGECVPKIWDVHLTASGSGSAFGSTGISEEEEEMEVKKGKECAEEERGGGGLVFRKEDGRIRWSDIQPLAAARVLSKNDISTSKHIPSVPPDSSSPSTHTAEPHDHDRDRPLQVAMIISMPVPPRYVHNPRRDSEKTAVSGLPLGSENDWSGQAYYELGVMTVR